MKTINDFEEFITYLNHVGIRYHGAGCIPVNQKLWCNLEYAIYQLGFVFPYNVRFYRNRNELYVRTLDRSMDAYVKPYDFS